MRMEFSRFHRFLQYYKRGVKRIFHGKSFLKPEERKITHPAVHYDFRIKVTGQEQEVGSLSGGNQQKVVIGHALATNPKLIILDEPTRGIDAGARTDVYNIIKGLSKKGLAVLFISSDMEEIIELSDRAVTIHQGRLNCEFDRADINQENLTKASFGVIGNIDFTNHDRKCHTNGDNDKHNR